MFWRGYGIKDFIYVVGFGVGFFGVGFGVGGVELGFGVGDCDSSGNYWVGGLGIGCVVL